MSAKTQKTLETFESLERETGLEPATSALARRRSTKCAIPAYVIEIQKNGAGNGTRTHYLRLEG